MKRINQIKSLKGLEPIMKKKLITLTLLALILSACTSQNAAIEKAVTQEAEPTDTATSAPTATATVNPVDQLLERYLAGEAVDTGTLSPAEFTEFSRRLSEKRNSDRGLTVVIFDNGDGNPAYIDNNFDMRPYDGQPSQDKVIEMFMPVEGFDSQGNLQVRQNGQVITVAYSAGVDWKAIITDPNDPRIDWPTGESIAAVLIKGNLTDPVGPMVLKPIIMLDDNTHEIFVEGYGMRDGLQILTAEETDVNDVPILLRRSVTTAGAIYYLEKEGTDLYQKERGEITIPENRTFYILFFTDSSYVYEHLITPNPSLDNYQGIVSTKKIYSIFSYQEKDQIKLIIIPVYIFLERIK